MQTVVHLRKAESSEQAKSSFYLALRDSVK